MVEDPLEAMEELRVVMVEDHPVGKKHLQVVTGHLQSLQVVDMEHPHHQVVMARQRLLEVMENK